MTECTRSPIAFSSLGKRKVVADFAGGTITSDGGVLLLRQIERRLRLIERMDAVLPDPRNPNLITHSQVSMLRQRIFAIALGQEDLNDHQTLRVDPLLQLACERTVDADQPLASPPTLCRLENRARRRPLVEAAKVLVEVFIESHKTAPQELILDFDATDDSVHGHQVGRFFHGYYDEYCFLPLYVFAGSQLLVAYLRPADQDGATHAWAILSRLVKRFRQVWPGVKIIFRGDSGFCRWKMLRWCERHEVGYIVGLAKNARLEALARPLMQQAKTLIQDPQDRPRVFGEFCYAAGTWDKARRILAKAEYLPAQRPDEKAKENFRFLVTNLAEAPQPLYEQTYCQRGEAENRIKEQQLGLFADRTSCHDFQANQLRVLLSAAAYVLLEHLRRTELAGTELEKAQMSTLRLKLLKIGGRVVVSARRIVLHLASSFPLQDLFHRLAARLMVPLSVT
jgi:hypothetical protein